MSLLHESTLAAPPAFDQVTSWGYQLTGYEGRGFDSLVSAPVDLLVIDLSRDGGSEYFTADEVSTIKSTDKIVLAYFEIGAIERYRPEWSAVPTDLMAGQVEGWPKEQYVKYWDERWWPVVQSRIELALKCGFDGIYLDLITAYEEIPDTGLSAEERAKRMVALLARISKFAKARNRDFKIVAQNCPELATWSFWEPHTNNTYLRAIDGLALESPFYLAHDKPCDQKWCRENRANAQFIKTQGKLLLGVDYAKAPRSLQDSYDRQREAGFIPYVSVRALDQFVAPPGS
ncbi:endo alpha-1,4 polygalactosaminidase [Adhaeretor mobilis]|uniref:endo alpha-1,4 polygalactosaminidase n=1 Tax=Adhaeretor mobilis TaxID=1930276 RepID=UPI001C54DE02|nr:endo alpha-1,4 polygalactosaminidase [Adhaeretor mobilis]